MSETRWALLKPDEDGNPLKWLTETEMRELLADPGQWGIDEFHHIDDLREQHRTTDPAYWHDKQAVLLRVEVVVPERGGWRLPEDASPVPFEPSPAQVRWMNGGDGPLTLGEAME